MNTNQAVNLNILLNLEEGDGDLLVAFLATFTLVPMNRHKPRGFELHVLQGKPTLQTGLRKNKERKREQ